MGVLGVALAGLGIRFKSFYQPPRSRFEHRIAVKARQSYGAELLPPNVGATRAALRLLSEEHGVLGIYGDEERQGYVHAPLFGRRPAPRANLVTAVRLAMASGAALVPCYVDRLEGARFNAVFMPPVDLLPGKAALDENIQRLDRAITAPILARLDQWYSLMDYYRPERFRRIESDA